MHRKIKTYWLAVQKPRGAGLERLPDAWSSQRSETRPRTSELPAWGEKPRIYCAPCRVKCAITRKSVYSRMSSRLGEGFYAVDLACFDQRSDAPPSLSALVVTRNQGVFAIEDDRTDHIFHAVGVDLDTAKHMIATRDDHDVKKNLAKSLKPMRPSGYEPLPAEDRSSCDFNRLGDNPLKRRHFPTEPCRSQPQQTGPDGEQSS